MTTLKSSNQKPLLIIPAAGYGSRVGNPISKEMFLGKDSKPLINNALQLAEKYNLEPLVITRKEKTNLIEYLKQHNVHTFFVEQTKDWPETIIKSQEFWHNINLVILPDTTFKPASIVEQLVSTLSYYDFVFGCFATANQSQWGMVEVFKNEFKICEKPKVTMPHALAWGLFGFKKHAGAKGLEKILESLTDGGWKTVAMSAKILELSEFLDHTRERL